MPSVKVTERELDSQAKAAVAAQKPTYVWDTELRGFGCYVTGKGKVSFLFQHWVGGRGGKPNRFKIGSRPALTVDAARKLAEGYRAQADSSKPVVPPKRQRIQLEREARAAAKLNDVWQDYEKDHKWGSDSHKDRVKTYFDNIILPTLKKDTAIRDITKEDISNLVKAKKRKHPIAARYLFRVLSPFFKYCVQEGYIAMSPMIGLTPPEASESRDRVLTESEIKAFWKATTGWDTGDLNRDLDKSIFNPFHRLLLLTGQRRDEVSWMEWAELDLDNSTWIIPAERTKNGKPHIVPLSPQAVAILTSLPRKTDRDGQEVRYLFTTVFLSAITGYGRPKERLDEAMKKELGEFPHWTLHDLRRTFVTISNEKGLADPHVIEAAVNHLTGLAKRGVAGTYNRAAYLKERVALFNAWGEYIEGLVAPKAQAPQAENVIVFPSASFAS
jgi:integrase